MVRQTLSSNDEVDIYPLKNGLIVKKYKKYGGAYERESDFVKNGLASQSIKGLLPMKEVKKGVFVSPAFCCSLHRFISDNTTMTHKKFVLIARQLCESVAAFHKTGYFHLDIKPANFVCGPERPVPHIVLMDYDKAVKDLNDVNFTNIGTLGYEAPEAIQDTNSKSGHSLDIWSLFATFYFVRTNGCPLMDCTAIEWGCEEDNDRLDQMSRQYSESLIANAAVMLRYRVGTDLSYESDGAKEDFLDFMKWGLKLSYKARPTIAQILAHPYMK